MTSPADDLLYAPLAQSAKVRMDPIADADEIVFEELDDPEIVSETEPDSECATENPEAVAALKLPPITLEKTFLRHLRLNVATVNRCEATEKECREKIKAAQRQRSESNKIATHLMATLKDKFIESTILVPARDNSNTVRTEYEFGGIRFGERRATRMSNGDLHIDYIFTNPENSSERAVLWWSGSSYDRAAHLQQNAALNIIVTLLGCLDENIVEIALNYEKTRVVENIVTQSGLRSRQCRSDLRRILRNRLKLVTIAAEVLTVAEKTFVKNIADLINLDQEDADAVANAQKWVEV